MQQRGFYIGALAKGEVHQPGVPWAGVDQALLTQNGGIRVTPGTEAFARGGSSHQARGPEVVELAGRAGGRPPGQHPVGGRVVRPPLGLPRRDGQVEELQPRVALPEQEGGGQVRAVDGGEVREVGQQVRERKDERVVAQAPAVGEVEAGEVGAGAAEEGEEGRLVELLAAREVEHLWAHTARADSAGPGKKKEYDRGIKGRLSHAVFSGGSHRENAGNLERAASTRASASFSFKPCGRSRRASGQPYDLIVQISRSMYMRAEG